MDKAEIELKVKNILANKFDIAIDKIKASSSLKDDLGIDSFGAIELIFEVEEKFGINISEEDMKEVKIVQDIIEYLRNRLENHNL